MLLGPVTKWRWRMNKNAEKQPVPLAHGGPALLYDGACPLCRREIALVRRLTSKNKVAFVDVHTLAPEHYPPGKNQADLLLDLHLVWPDGHIDQGLDANVRLWRQTPFGWLWRVFDLPLVRPMAHWTYRRWADRRYANMGYCAATPLQRRKKDQS